MSEYLLERLSISYPEDQEWVALVRVAYFPVAVLTGRLRSDSYLAKAARIWQSGGIAYWTQRPNGSDLECCASASDAHFLHTLTDYVLNLTNEAIVAYDGYDTRKHFRYVGDLPSAFLTERPAISLLCVRERDNVRAEEDFPIRGYIVMDDVLLYHVDYQGNGAGLPEAGDTIQDVLAWSALDSTGLHPEVSREVQVGGSSNFQARVSREEMDAVLLRNRINSTEELPMWNRSDIHAA
jgi:hypothetical protein